jgi:hypothetical protein
VPGGESLPNREAMLVVWGKSVRQGMYRRGCEIYPQIVVIKPHVCMYVFIRAGQSPGVIGWPDYVCFLCSR